MFFSSKPNILGECVVGGVSKDALLERLHTAGVEVESWIQDIVGMPTFLMPIESERVRFATMSLKGYRTFGKMTPRSTIADILADVGGVQCQPADMLFLLPMLAHTGQLKQGRKFECAMEPVPHLDGDYDIFVVEQRGRKLHLVADPAFACFAFIAAGEIVFRLPPKS